MVSTGIGWKLGGPLGARRRRRQPADAAPRSGSPPARGCRWSAGPPGRRPRTAAGSAACTGASTRARVRNDHHLQVPGLLRAAGTARPPVKKRHVPAGPVHRRVLSGSAATAVRPAVTPGGMPAQPPRQHRHGAPRIRDQRQLFHPAPVPCDPTPSASPADSCESSTSPRYATTGTPPGPRSVSPIRSLTAMPTPSTCSSLGERPLQESRAGPAAPAPPRPRPPRAAALWTQRCSGSRRPTSRGPGRPSRPTVLEATIDAAGVGDHDGRVAFLRAHHLVGEPGEVLGVPAGRWPGR